MAKFEKGQSGNPTGRVAGSRRVRDMLRSGKKLAVQALLDVAGDGSAPADARVSASQTLLTMAGMCVKTEARKSESAELAG